MGMRKTTRYSQFIKSLDQVIITAGSGKRAVSLKEILDLLGVSELMVSLQSLNVKAELSLSLELGNFWVEITEREPT